MQASREKMQKMGRLKRRSCFLRVQKDGKKWVSKGLILQAAQSEDPENSRFGITVTRRVSKSAVVRNRIKRRLRAAACDVIPDHVKNGLDFVLIGRAETERYPYADLKKDLKWCLGRLECLKDGDK